jgi:hypothetical protein
VLLAILAPLLGKCDLELALVLAVELGDPMYPLGVKQL